MHEEFISDIRLNAVRNSSIFHNETQTISIPKWLQQLPEKVLNLSSKTDIIRMEIEASLNKPESPLYFLTFILSLLTIVIIILLLLSLCCWLCWRNGKILSKFRNKKSKTINDKKDRMQNITNVNVLPSTQKCIDYRNKGEERRKVEMETEERITIDKYDKPTRSGMYCKSPCDNYFSEESHIDGSYKEFGVDRFERKETVNYPINQKWTRKIGGESYGSILLKNDKFNRRIDCGEDNEIVKTETYEIGRC
uniref:Uncharacterized protein n=1 Tax=Strongyloides papillosus TaxID=174720 RepID=A0A0N5C3R7_STREA